MNSLRSQLKRNSRRLGSVSHKPQSRQFSLTITVLAHKVGIVGLPNVGKSLLFNALMGKTIARSENFPFCTIDPNTATAEYPDPRLKTIAKVQKPKKITNIGVQFVDIAGLVEGASEGSGLGNQFLSNISNVDVILHVVRSFSLDYNVSHVLDTVDPVRDVKIITKELVQKDIQSLETIKRGKGPKHPNIDPKEYIRVGTTVYDLLKSGKSAFDLGISPDHADFEVLQSMKLLSVKPVLYVANVDETSAENGNEFSRALEDYVKKLGHGEVVTLSAALEFELATLQDPASKKEIIEGYGLTKNGLEQIIRKSFGLLGLIMFYTMGPKEVRGWPIPKGIKARDAAGVIHSDFVKGFIKAETWTIQEFVDTNGKPKRQVKGADYIVQDGDCFEFKIKG